MDNGFGTTRVMLFSTPLDLFMLILSLLFVSYALAVEAPDNCRLRGTLTYISSKVVLLATGNQISRAVVRLHLNKVLALVPALHAYSPLPPVDIAIPELLMRYIQYNTLSYFETPEDLKNMAMVPNTYLVRLLTNLIIPLG